MKNPDRVKLEKVAKGYHDLMMLQSKQRETMALMIRTCVVRLGSTDPAKRKEATKTLSDLADMLHPIL